MDKETRDIFKLWKEHVEKEHVGERTEENFTESYCGEWESAEYFASHQLDKLYNIPAELIYYFDYTKWCRNLFSTEYFYIDTPEEHGVYIFRY